MVSGNVTQQTSALPSPPNSKTVVRFNRFDRNEVRRSREPRTGANLTQSLYNLSDLMSIVLNKEQHLWTLIDTTHWKRIELGQKTINA